MMSITVQDKPYKIRVFGCITIVLSTTLSDEQHSLSLGLKIRYSFITKVMFLKIIQNSCKKL